MTAFWYVRGGRCEPDVLSEVVATCLSQLHLRGHTKRHTPLFHPPSPHLTRCPPAVCPVQECDLVVAIEGGVGPAGLGQAGILECFAWVCAMDPHTGEWAVSKVMLPVTPVLLVVRWSWDKV